MEYPPNTRVFIGMDDLVHIGSAVFGGTWCADFRYEETSDQDFVQDTTDDVDCSFCLEALAEDA